ncbi:MAG: hypothetical protein R3F19_12705 [Verrucomicrobiales bacterium]|nr:hypothetical protein [Verrucomicrobiae bacterium]
MITELTNPRETYQTDDHPQTLTFQAKAQTLALPYFHLRSIRLSRDRASIAIDYDDFGIVIHGAHLEKLWRELRAYRLLEVSVSLLTTVESEIASESGRCRVERIDIQTKGEEDGDG